MYSSTSVASLIISTILESIKWILMQLLCKMHFDWLKIWGILTNDTLSQIQRGPNHENIYPYIYIQIYFHSSDFARILKTVSNLKTRCQMAIMDAFFWDNIDLEGSVSTGTWFMLKFTVNDDLDMSLLNMCGSTRCMCMPNIKYMSLLVQKL